MSITGIMTEPVFESSHKLRDKTSIEMKYSLGSFVNYELGLGICPRGFRKWFDIPHEHTGRIWLNIFSGYGLSLEERAQRNIYRLTIRSTIYRNWACYLDMMTHSKSEVYSGLDLTWEQLQGLMIHTCLMRRTKDYIGVEYEVD